MTGIQPLPTDFNRYGHRYHQLWRDERTAIYEYFSRQGRPAGYELIIIKICPADRFGPERECYPRNSQWGKLAISICATESIDYCKRRLAIRLSTGSFNETGKLRVLPKPDTVTHPAVEVMEDSGPQNRR
jgi:hypothetical protein